MSLSDPKLNKIILTLVYVYTLSVYGSMAMMSLGSVLVMTGFILLIIFHKNFNLKNEFKLFSQNLLFLPTVFLSVACIWSLVWAKYTGVEFYGMKPKVSFDDVRKLWHLFFPLLFLSFLSRLEIFDLIKVVRFWLSVGLCLAVFGILQYYFPIYKSQMLPHLTYGNYEKGSGILALLKGSYHATGLTGFHLSFASIFAFPTAVWFAFAGFKFRDNSLNRKTKFLFFGSVLFFITNILTYSKTTWVATPLLVLGTTFLAMKGRIRYVLTAIIVVFGIVGINSSEFKMRFQGTDTIKERLEIWSANIEMIKQNPLFGVGWHHNSDLSEAYYTQKGMHGFVSHAHNNILDQFASTGLFGLVGFLWWCFIIVWLAIQIYRKSEESFWRAIGFGFLGGWFCLHLNGMTQTNFWDAKVLHQISWVTAITLEVYRRKINSA